MHLLSLIIFRDALPVFLIRPSKTGTMAFPFGQSFCLAQFAFLATCGGNNSMKCLLFLATSCLIALSARGECPLSFNAPASFLANIFPNSVAIGDLNHDGIPDLAVARDGGTISVFRGNGNGTFSANGNPTVGASAYAV